MSEVIRLRTEWAMTIGARIYAAINGERDPHFSFGLPMKEEIAALAGYEAGLKFRLKELEMPIEERC